MERGRCPSAISRPYVDRPVRCRRFRPCSLQVHGDDPGAAPSARKRIGPNISPEPSPPVQEDHRRPAPCVSVVEVEGRFDLGRSARRPGVPDAQSVVVTGAAPSRRPLTVLCRVQTVPSPVTHRQVTGPPPAYAGAMHLGLVAIVVGRLRLSYQLLHRRALAFEAGRGTPPAPGQRRAAQALGRWSKPTGVPSRACC